MRYLLVASAALLSPTLLTAQERPSDTLLTVNRYLDFESVSQPKVSPDGSQVFWTRSSVDKMKDQFETGLWLMNADGSKQRFLVKGSNAVWSPDGTRIAYLAEGEPGGNQIWVRYMDAEGAITQVTREQKASANIKWSPDGKSIGFSMFVPSVPSWKIDLPSAPPGANWTKAPRLVEALHYRADRQGFLDAGYTHLFVVPAIGGTPRQITKGEWNVGARGTGLPGSVGWDWAPDGQSVVVEGNDDPKAELQRLRSDLYRVTLATGEKRRLTDGAGFWSNPQVSPDGKLIAYLGRSNPEDTYRTSVLHTMNLDGSGATARTQGLDRDPSSVIWAPDSRGLYFTAADQGTSNLQYVALGGAPRQLTTGVHMLTQTSIAKNGTAFAVRSHYSAPPDIVRIDLKRPAALTQLTEVNADLLAGTRLGEVEEVWYTSTGGARVHGWIVKPPSFDPSKKYPLIMEIHGGPHGMYGVGFSYMYQNFAANGFVVLYTNPRGSTGYGSAFGNAINKAYPSVDYDDLMAGVDTVVGRGYIDTNAMYVGGCSGGGVLSSWVIAHTTRFAAAAVRCPVINWMSFAGNTDIPLFTFNWFEKPFWEDPSAWLKQSSLMHVKNVKTPVLLMTGVLDLRTPMPETEQYYAALKMLGVPVAMLRFENEWHVTSSRPSNFMRTQLYMMSWYKRWTKGAQ
ncbi:MAG TPA: S9 family peptidase, partial [Gemmatimonadales bacterium]